MQVGKVRVALLVIVGCLAWTATAEEQSRTAVFISDVHLGLGANPPKAPDEKVTWHPKEDFRWPAVVKPFLQALTTKYGPGIDLVVLGDLFELWQPPDDIACESNNADVGCTLSTMETIAARIAEKHDTELKELGAFAMRDNNRVYIVPGNHDSALLVPAVWKTVAPRFGASSDRVQLVPSGAWVSTDGLILGEHGHQLKPDANAYARWPEVTTRPRKGEARMIRPWGEYFVQRLFNREEKHYPLIDNVTGSAGAKFRMQDQGFAGTALDFVRFIRFVLWENSFRQRLAFLDEEEEVHEPRVDDWDIGWARKRKHELVVMALPETDFLRQTLIAKTPQGKAARAEMDAAVQKSMSDDEIAAYCAAIPRSADGHPCIRSMLGHVLRGVGVIPLSYALRRHLDNRKDAPSAAVFVYGHTHALQEPWSLGVTSTRVVTIANTGAFHRLIDEETFRAAAAEEKLPPGQALKDLSFDVLPPCHTAVVVTYADGLPQPALKQWVGEADGALKDACEGVCARVSGCPKQP